VEDAVRVLAHHDDPPPPGRRLRLVRFDLVRPGRAVRLGFPLIPVALMLIWVELMLFPFVAVGLRVAARKAARPGVARFLRELPPLPLSRFLVALMKSRAPFGVAIRDAEGGFALRIN